MYILIIKYKDIFIWRVKVIWPPVLTQWQTWGSSLFFCISQFTWLAAAGLFPTPPTVTRPQWFFVWTCSLLSIVSVSFCYFPICRLMVQTGMTFVCKKRDRTVKRSSPAICFWLQVAVSDCLLELQFGFLNCAIGSSSCAPHCAGGFWELEPGLDQRERQRKRGIKYSQHGSLSCGRLTVFSRLWRPRHLATWYLEITPTFYNIINNENNNGCALVIA